MPHSKSEGFTIWLTGPSGAGKSTLAAALERELRRRGSRTEILDGDEIRASLSPDLGFSKADRDLHIRRVGYIARLLSRNGVVALAAVISPYRDARREVRAQHECPFVEVWVNCAMEELVRRNRKGLYAKALAGEIRNFTGLSDPYEPPDRPEIIVHTHQETLEQSLAAIVPWLERHDLLVPSPPSTTLCST